MASALSPMRSSLAASTSCSRPRAMVAAPRRTLSRVAARPSHKVEIDNMGTTIVLDVPEGENILAAALDKGIDLPHDCKLGVCMTCPAKLMSGKIEQGAAMLSEDITSKGYALLCVAQPTSDCKIKIITEDELLEQQFGQ